MGLRRRRLTLQAFVLVFSVLVAVLGFLFAVQLLSEAMRMLSPAIRPVLRRGGGISLIGVSWLSAYVLLNGSAVAAIALSLFSAELLTVTELFLLVSGSRLGAAGIVVLIGGLDYLRTSEYSLAEAVRLGTLTFLVSYSIYVPATVIGVATIQWVERDGWTDSVGVPDSLSWLAFFEPLVSVTIRLLGAVPSVLLALFLLIGSLHVLDHQFDRTETEWFRERVFVHLRNRWLSFALGLTITAVTTSVAFSMGVIVPVYNRGYIKRHEIVPFIMGASIGTLSDTLLVAIVLDSTAGVSVVFLLFATATVCTLVALVCYERYYRVIDEIQRSLLEERWAFTVFLGSLVVIPLVLVSLSAF